MQDPASTDLNTVISAAVNARVEAAVVTALSGDDVIGQYVMAALQQVVEVPKPGSSYDKVKVPFINHVISESIRRAATHAVGVALEQESEQIHKLVHAAVRKQLKPMADRMAENLLEQSKSQYGLKVNVDWQSR